MTANLFTDTSTRSLRPLRTRQEFGLKGMRDSFRKGNKHIVLYGPCSFGKTQVAAHMAHKCVRNGGRVLFQVPLLSLVGQTYDKFYSEGFTSLGVIHADDPRTNPYASVQIASKQTLYARNYDLSGYQLIIDDECHIQFAKMYERMKDIWKETAVIGLSGTPWSYGMGLHWQDLVIPATMRELMDEGLLAPYDTYCPADEYEVDMSDVKVQADEEGEKDWNKKQTARKMMSPVIVGDVVKTWKEKGSPNRNLLFAVNRAHAKHMQEQFELAGVRTGYIDANTTSSERNDVWDALEAEDISIVCSVAAIGTGVDKRVYGIIYLAPTKSKKKWVQDVARMLRTDDFDPLKRGILLDHSGNAQRLGLPEDIHEPRLHMGEQEPKKESKPKNGDGAEEPLPKKCKNCHALIPPREQKCPKCGVEPKRTNTVEHVPGELVLFGSKVKGKKGADKFSPQDKQRWYRELLGYAQDHGKQDSWVLAKFRAKFDEWPHQKNGISPLPVSLEVSNWVKASNIRFFKAKEKAQQAVAQ